jgi:FtsH-binding integral membrane protein
MAQARAIPAASEVRFNRFLALYLDFINLFLLLLRTSRR